MKTTALLILSKLGITLLLSSVAAAEFDPRPASKKIDSFLNAHLNVASTRPNLPSRIRAIPWLMAAHGAGGFVTARLPCHLKLPTPPAEELAEILYNTVRDFFGPNMGVS